MLWYEMWFPTVLGGGLDMRMWEWLIATFPIWFGPVVMLLFTLALWMGSPE
jgi:hypothetical protein